MTALPIHMFICTDTEVLFQSEMFIKYLQANQVPSLLNSIFNFINSFEIVTQNETTKTLKTKACTYFQVEIREITFEDTKSKLYILNDITALIEIQHIKRDQELSELLVATSTHEMRTPLHCIKNTLDMLQDEGRNEDEFISRAIVACEMQECYINDMLDYSKFKRNTLSVVSESISVNELLKEISNYFLFSASESDLYLKLEIPEEPIIIKADYMRLKQIFFNLLSNAFKFTTEGGIIISAKLEQDKVFLKVEDTGVGINPDDIHNLFKPFSMLETTRMKNKTGSGLGLFLSQKYCELMGSQIDVTSQVNKGTQFIMTFALQKEEVVAVKKYSMHTLASSNKESKINILMQNCSKALIVDDSGFNLRILQKMLEMLNVGSYRSLNGKYALSLVKVNDDIKIAFVDLNMPLMNGFELIKSITSYYASKNRECPFPIFALTGETSEEIKKQCFELGFKGFLVKPFTKAMLKKILSQYRVINEVDSDL